MCRGRWAEVRRGPRVGIWRATRGSLTGRANVPTREPRRPACSVAAMSRALVLNATFEPLCVVSDRRAVVLVLGETAEMLHASDVAHALGPPGHGGAVGGAPPALRPRAVPVDDPAQPPVGVRPRRAPVPVLRRPGREHRPRRPAQPGWPPLVGQRRRRLPAVQRAQARSHAVRDVDVAAAPAVRAAGHELAHVRAGRRARHVDAVPARSRRDARARPGHAGASSAGAARPPTSTPRRCPTSPCGRRGCSRRRAGAGARVDPGARPGRRGRRPRRRRRRGAPPVGWGSGVRRPADHGVGRRDRPGRRSAVGRRRRPGRAVGRRGVAGGAGRPRESGRCWCTTARWPADRSAGWCASARWGRAR